VLDSSCVRANVNQGSFGQTCNLRLLFIVTRSMEAQTAFPISSRLSRERSQTCIPSYWNHWPNMLAIEPKELREYFNGLFAAKDP
jgi:hypothetical protein